MTDLSVAKEIARQIGNKALFMMGAKNLAGDKNSLHFKIGRNAKGVTHVVVELNGMDLYDVKFYACRAGERKLKSEALGLYCDMLHEALESNTGLYVSL